MRVAETTCNSFTRTARHTAAERCVHIASFLSTATGKLDRLSGFETDLSRPDAPSDSRVLPPHSPLLLLHPGSSWANERLRSPLALMLLTLCSLDFIH